MTDVIVCDGFVGNVLVKYSEGLGRIMSHWLGPLELGALPVGVYRFLNKMEIETIKSLEKKLKKTPPPKTVRKIHKSKAT